MDGFRREICIFSKRSHVLEYGYFSCKRKWHQETLKLGLLLYIMLMWISTWLVSVMEILVEVRLIFDLNICEMITNLVLTVINTTFWNVWMAQQFVTRASNVLIQTSCMDMVCRNSEHLSRDSRELIWSYNTFLGSFVWKMERESEIFLQFCS